MENQESIPSPCVRNCCLNERDICLGCFRSLQEICNWSQTDNKQRILILNNAKRRRLLHAAKSSTSKTILYRDKR